MDRYRSETPLHFCSDQKFQAAGILIGARAILPSCFGKEKKNLAKGLGDHISATCSIIETNKYPDYDPHVAHALLEFF